MIDVSSSVKLHIDGDPVRNSSHIRWWIYQKERFPLAAHTPIIGAFSLAAVGYSVLARSSANSVGMRPLFVAFVCSFLFFLQLRLADEFKDFEEDSLYRPYRPVPRGLVTLRELAIVWAGSVVLQLAIIMWFSIRLLPLLTFVWFYLLLMSKEFFVRTWLKRHEIIYMVSHMIIMPLIFLFASACDWIPAGFTRLPQPLTWMILVNFFVGIVLEIGRKIRAPADEEHGVETYSLLWGRETATVVWVGVMSISAALIYPAARAIHFTQIELALVPMALVAVVTGAAFLRHSGPGRGKWIEAISGLWSLLVYLGIGAVPLAMRWYGGHK